MKAEWYVIQVISWTEENVRQSLFQRRESFSLEEYILDVFVPTHDIVSVRASWEKVKKKKQDYVEAYELFLELSTSGSTYAKIENGQLIPKVDRLQQIANILEVDLSTLLNSTNNFTINFNSTANQSGYINN